MIVGSVVVPILCMALEWYSAMGVTLLMMPLLFWGGFILLILFSDPLVIHDHDGEHFWLAGCSEDFLWTIKARAFDEEEPAAVS